MRFIVDMVRSARLPAQLGDWRYLVAHAFIVVPNSPQTNTTKMTTVLILHIDTHHSPNT